MSGADDYNELSLGLAEYIDQATGLLFAAELVDTGDPGECVVLSREPSDKTEFVAVRGRAEGFLAGVAWQFKRDQHPPTRDSQNTPANGEGG